MNTFYSYYLNDSTLKNIKRMVDSGQIKSVGPCKSGRPDIVELNQYIRFLLDNKN